MNVLSLFDGISCARLALDRAGIKVDNYFASEVCKYALAVSQRNYPDTTHLGDVRTLDISSLPKIDLLIGGSPCQNLSTNQVNFKQGLTGKSLLFFEYVRIREAINPTYFVLENVASMQNKDKETISGYMGCQPIMIDAALVSAQTRKRYFWTNIPNVDLPADRNIHFKDILTPREERENLYIMRQMFKTFRETRTGKIPTLLAYNTKPFWIMADGEKIRKLNITEWERLQGLPDNYTEGISETRRREVIGNAFNVDVVAHILGKLNV